MLQQTEIDTLQRLYSKANQINATWVPRRGSSAGIYTDKMNTTGGYGDESTTPYNVLSCQGGVGSGHKEESTRDFLIEYFNNFSDLTKAAQFMADLAAGNFYIRSSRGYDGSIRYDWICRRASDTQSGYSESVHDSFRDYFKTKFPTDPVKKLRSLVSGKPDDERVIVDVADLRKTLARVTK